MAAKSRRCIQCGEMFPSPNAGVRVCDACRPEWEDKRAGKLFECDEMLTATAKPFWDDEIEQLSEDAIIERWLEEEEA